MFYIRPRTRRAPTHPVRMNLSSPQANGLVYRWPMAYGWGWREQVNGDNVYNTLAPLASRRVEWRQDHAWFIGGQRLRLAARSTWGPWLEPGGGPKDFTILCWVYKDNSNSRNNVFGDSSSTGTLTSCQIAYVNDTIRYGVRFQGGGFLSYTDGIDKPLNIYSCVAIIRRGNDIEAWEDGRFKNTFATSALGLTTSTTSTQYPSFGRTGANTTNPLNPGGIKDARIYNRALSAEEMLAIYTHQYDLDGSPPPIYFIPTAAPGVTLTVADALHAHAADNVDLTQAHTLAVGAVDHAQPVENVDLTQAHTLAVDAADHAHAADNVDLVQANVLVLDDVTHAHPVDNVVLEVGVVLAVADVAHAHPVESPALTQAHILAVAEALHSHAADNVVLDVGVILSVAAVDHAHTAEAVALTQAHILALDESLHAHLVDSPALIQASTLTVADVAHGHTAENVTLDFSAILVVQDTAHGHAADNVTLEVGLILAVQEALHAHTADSPSLTQANILVVDDVLHAHLVANVALIDDQAAIGGVDRRVILLEADSTRVLVMPSPKVRL